MSLYANYPEAIRIQMLQHDAKMQGEAAAQSHVVNHLLNPPPSTSPQPPLPSQSPGIIICQDQNGQIVHEEIHRASDTLTVDSRDAFKAKPEPRSQERTMRVLTPIVTLRRALKSGSVDVFAVGKTIYEGFRAGTLVQSEYDAFVASKSTLQIRRIDNSNINSAIDNISEDTVADIQNIMRYSAAGNKFLHDISFGKAHHAQNLVHNLEVKCVETISVEQSDIVVSIANLVDEWKIPANGPFKEQTLNDMVKTWTPCLDPRAGRRLQDCLRHIFKQITRPYKDILSYTQVIGGRKRTEKYLPLPEDVLMVLKNFSLQLAGFGSKEVRDCTLTYEECVQLNSIYWRGLSAESPEEKFVQVQSRRAEASLWTTNYVITSIQSALNGLRRGFFRPKRDAQNEIIIDKDGDVVMEWISDKSKQPGDDDEDDGPTNKRAKESQ